MARFDRTIPPGGEGKIVLEMDTNVIHGDIYKKARVATNDPENPYVTVGLIGKIWTPISVKPRRANLDGVLGKEILAVVRMWAEKEEPLVLKVDSVSIPDKVAVLVEEHEKDRVWDLRVMNKVQRAEQYKGEVRLTTNYPEKPTMVIQILGNVRGHLEVRPKQLNFGRISEEQIKKKASGKVPTRWVTVILNKGTDLKIYTNQKDGKVLEVSIRIQI